MKAKSKRKPARIEKVTAYITMSDKRRLVILDISLDTLTVMGQFYAAKGDLFDKTWQEKPLPGQTTSTGSSKGKNTKR